MSEEHVIIDNIGKNKIPDLLQKSNLAIMLFLAMSVKANKPRSIQIFGLMMNTLNKYTDEELQHIERVKNPMLNKDNPGATVYEKFYNLYLSIKNELLESQSPKLVELNELLKSLTKVEEEEFVEIAVNSISNPSSVFL